MSVEEAAEWLMGQARPEIAMRKKTNRLTRLGRKAINLYRIKFN